MIAGLGLEKSELLGRTLANKIEIQAFVGHGSMGAVFKARHRTLDKIVAVKVMRRFNTADRIRSERFVREAQIAARFDHPHTVQILDFGEDGADQLLYLVMEFLDGRDLHRLLVDEGPMEPVRLAELMLQVLSVLAAAHDQGVVHRDIKPANIMVLVRPNDEGFASEYVKVCDFGLAKMFNLDNKVSFDRATREPVVIGTPIYMSPEQAVDEPLDGRTDVYSCGVVLYEMLTGRPPFLADAPLKVLMKHLSEAPVPPSAIAPGIDKRLDEIILWTLQKPRDQRCPSARDLRKALAEYVASSPKRPRVKAPVAARTRGKESAFETAMIPGRGRQKLDAPTDVLARESLETETMPAVVPMVPATPTVISEHETLDDKTHDEDSHDAETLRATREAVRRAMRELDGESVEPQPEITVRARVELPPEEDEEVSVLEIDTWRDLSSAEGERTKRHSSRRPRSTASFDGSIPVALRDSAILGPAASEPGELPADAILGPAMSSSAGGASVWKEGVVDMDALVAEAVEDLGPTSGPAGGHRSGMHALAGIDFRKHASAVSDISQYMWKHYGIMFEPHAGANPFWVRDHNRETLGPLTHKELLKVLRQEGLAGQAAGVAVSADRESWMTAASFVKLTGQETLLSNELQTARELAQGPFGGVLAKTSLTSLFGRISRERPTGRLCFRSEDYSTVSSVEIHFVSGKPTFVYTSDPSFELPQLLVEKKLITAQMLPQFLRTVLIEELPIETVVARATGVDIVPYRVMFMKARLQHLFAWRKKGAFGFDTDSLPASMTPFAESMLALLPDLVYHNLSLDELNHAVWPYLNLVPERSQRFGAALKDMRLLEAQQKIAAKFGKPRSVGDSLKSSPQEEKMHLALAYILLETDLLLKPI